jgi:peptide/nickel transport system permease protein
MTAYIFRKTGSTLLTAFLIAIVCFSILYFSPGDPATILLKYKNPSGSLDPRMVEMLAEKLGLRDGFFPQFTRWLKDALQGDLGYSFKTGLPVTQEFGERIGRTLALVLFASVVSTLSGMLLGVLSVLQHNRFIDKLIRFYAVINMATPSFWVGILFLWIFAIKLKLFPPFGFYGFSSIVLPGIVLALGQTATVVRVSKVCMLENMGCPYVTIARAKGLKESAILVRHVLKNVLLPVITISGMNLVSIISGSTIIENIFGFPGLGSYLVTAINVKDFPVIMGFTLLIGMIVISVNLIIDLLYALIDPRVMQSYNETF